MILHRYFARRFLVAFLMIATVFGALIGLVDMIEQIRRFGDEDGVGVFQVLWLTVLKLPTTMNEILPLLVILATIALFISLARSSELVVTRAAGRSAMRALVAPVVVALCLGALAVTVLNPIVAGTASHYQSVTESYKSGASSALSIGGEGLWLRQGGDNEQTVIHARSVSDDATLFFDVSFLTYSPDGDPIRRIRAENAQLRDGAWHLRNTKTWLLTSTRAPEASALEADELELKTTLTLTRIRESLGTPEGISIWKLQTFIAQLERAGFSTLRHRVWFQTELARPLFLAGMVLIAAAFTMRHTRFGGIGIAAMTAVLLGFGMYFIRSFAQVLGEAGQIPIWLAAWAPPAAAICLAVGFLLHAEDG